MQPKVELGAGSEVGVWAVEEGARSALATVGAEAGPRVGLGTRHEEAGGADDLTACCSPPECSPPVSPVCSTMLLELCPTEEPLCRCCVPHFCCRPACRRGDGGVMGWWWGRRAETRRKGSLWLEPSLESEVTPPESGTWRGLYCSCCVMNWVLLHNSADGCAPQSRPPILDPPRDVRPAGGCRDAADVFSSSGCSGASLWAPLQLEAPMKMPWSVSGWSVSG